MKNKKVILIIGGHDPTGGAGIVADIETANYYKYHALSILTCSTIQNTSKFIKINIMPKNYITNSFNAIIKEFKIDVVKIGLLPTINCSKQVLNIINNKKLKNVPIIIDPIIKSGTNKLITTKNNLKFQINNIYPKSYVITPNLYEYDFLKKINSNFVENSSKNILITDYNVKKNIIYLKLKNNKNSYFMSKKINKNFHGTGCTFTSSIACNIGLNRSLKKSIEESLIFISKSMLHSSLKGLKQSLLNRSF
tara:strand:- start:19118 stop:19870 length:753 start_codon:yes stop_codon:yes gene_type:complete